MKKIGIDAISYYVPSIYLSIEKLSEHRNLDYEKLNKGLGLEKMAIADSNEDPSSFAANALISLFEKNNIDPKEIGRIYMGCLLYTSPSPRDLAVSRMPSSA